MAPGRGASRLRASRGLGRRAGRGLLLNVAHAAVWFLSVNEAPVESFSAPFCGQPLSRPAPAPQGWRGRVRLIARSSTAVRAPVVALETVPVAHDEGSYDYHADHHTEMETYCPDPLLPRGSTLYPVPERNLPPLIHHFKTHCPWARVSELVCAMTDLEEEFVGELIRFGAVYQAVPLPDGKWHEGLSKVEGMSNAERVTVDVPVPKEAYIRVHVNPKRHPRAIRDDWRERIIKTVEDAYILDKPAGVPMVPTVDNLVESALFQVSKCTGEDLFVTSRLDGCTSGVVILARSSAAAGTYNKVIREGNHHKMYRLLCQGPVPVGKVQHGYKKLRGRLHAKPTLLSGKVDHRYDHDRNMWQLAELDVVSCKPVYEAPGGNVLYECLVELVTGRTHQIRLQFAAMSAPLVGDSRYEPVSGLLDDGPHTPWGDGSALFGPEPEQICLQASRVDLRLEGKGWVSYEAGKPWWHDLVSYEEAHKLMPVDVFAVSLVLPVHPGRSAGNTTCVF